MEHYTFQTVPSADLNTTSNELLVKDITPSTPSTPQHLSYNPFGETWVGVTLILALISFVCCTCTLLLYHKLQVKPSVQVHPLTVEAGLGGDATNYPEDLPNYTLVSGLPNYEEALEQLRRAQELRRPSQTKMLNHHYATYNGHQKHPTRLSVMELLQRYNRRNSIES